MRLSPFPSALFFRGRALSVSRGAHPRAPRRARARVLDAGRDRPRARRLAATARAKHQGPPLHAAEARDADAWLASHTGV